MVLDLHGPSEQIIIEFDAIHTAVLYTRPLMHNRMTSGVTVAAPQSLTSSSRYSFCSACDRHQKRDKARGEWQGRKRGEAQTPTWHRNIT